MRSAVQLTNPTFSPTGAVVVAASLGGLQALQEMLGGVPRDFPAPIIVAHHLSDRGPSYFVDLLAAHTPLAVQWAETAKAFSPGHVYVAPCGFHITITRSGRCRLDNAPRKNFVRPNCDLLFQSAAEHLGDRLTAVVLSGRLRDGALGVMAVAEAGGIVLAQSPSTCVAPGMPNAAVATGRVHFVLPPRVIGDALVSLAMVPGAAEMFGVGVARRSSRPAA
jgi:two-component system chemotaxis response regulator CheB